MNVKAFFDAIRDSFPRGRLSAAQVEGMETILSTAINMPLPHIAYILATAYHETGALMQPVREGFCKTDRGSRRAVTALYNKGVIRWDYGLPHEVTGLSYYGRGYVQLTHYENYEKTGKALGFDLVNNPDLMLDPAISAKAMVWGMVTGAYRGKSLDMLPETPTDAQWRSARGIINGDVGRNGSKVGRYAKHFLSALEKANE